MAEGFSDEMAAWMRRHDRPEGVTVDELAQALGLTTGTVHQFLYRATRSGILTKRPASWRLAPASRGDHDGS